MVSGNENVCLSALDELQNPEAQRLVVQGGLLDQLRRVFEQPVGKRRAELGFHRLADRRHR